MTKTSPNVPNQALVTHLPPDHPPVYRIPQVAHLLSCSPEHVWQLVKSGAIASIRIHPSKKRSRIRIPVSEVLNLLKPC